MANYSLTPYYEDIIQRAMDMGIYANASETVRAGLRLLEKQLEYEAKLRDLRTAIDEGESSPDVPYDIENVIARGRERRARKQAPENHG